MTTRTPVTLSERQLADLSFEDSGLPDRPVPGLTPDQLRSAQHAQAERARVARQALRLIG